MKEPKDITINITYHIRPFRFIPKFEKIATEYWVFWLNFMISIEFE